MAREDLVDQLAHQTPAVAMGKADVGISQGPLQDIFAVLQHVPNALAHHPRAARRRTYVPGIRT